MKLKQQQKKKRMFTNKVCIFWSKQYCSTDFACPEIWKKWKGDCIFFKQGLFFFAGIMYVCSLQVSLVKHSNTVNSEIDHVATGGRGYDSKRLFFISTTPNERRNQTDVNSIFFFFFFTCARFFFFFFHTYQLDISKMIY